MRPIRVLFRSHEITETAFSLNIFVFRKRCHGFPTLAPLSSSSQIQAKRHQRHCNTFPLPREP